MSVMPPTHLSWTKTDGEITLLDFRTWTYSRLDEAAAEVWESLAAGKSPAETARRIAGERDVTVGRARADILALLRRLDGRATPRGGLWRRKAQPVWRLHEVRPDLFKALCRKAGLAKAYRSLLKALPVARTCRPFKSAGCFRLRGHLRSFCLEVPGGVVAMKGSEPLSADWEAALRGLRPREHFPRVERKVPLALTLEAALDEAEKAAELQSAHLLRYGRLARVPLPLLVCRWPERRIERFRRKLRRLLSPAARRSIEGPLGGDLAAYVYYYPSVPLRARHLAEDVDAAARGRRADRLGLTMKFGSIFLSGFRPSETVRRWIALFARMLDLGFVPCGSVRSATGTCVRSQNAVLDGGFADLDSLRNVTSFKGERELRKAFRMSAAELFRTIRTLWS